MLFESLAMKHADLLLQFELTNRVWFETLISSRGDDFYNQAGVKTHISSLLAGEQRGENYSAVLIENNIIVARANIKNICDRSNVCEVGYRVGQKNIGKGYASYCLSELIRIAQISYGVKTILADVLDNNPASAAILKKLAFSVISHQDNYITLNGDILGCTRYRYTRQSA